MDNQCVFPLGLQPLLAVVRIDRRGPDGRSTTRLAHHSPGMSGERGPDAAVRGRVGIELEDRFAGTFRSELQCEPAAGRRTGRDFSGDLEWTRVPDRKQVPQYQRVVRKR